jgi:hypothetical protein
MLQCKPAIRALAAPTARSAAWAPSLLVATPPRRNPTARHAPRAAQRLQLVQPIQQHAPVSVRAHTPHRLPVRSVQVGSWFQESEAFGFRIQGETLNILMNAESLSAPSPLASIFKLLARSPHPCVPVAVCGPGTGGANCTLCSVGTYSAGGNATLPTPGCLTCPDGSTTPDAGARNVTACSGVRAWSLGLEAHSIKPHACAQPSHRPWPCISRDRQHAACSTQCAGHTACAQCAACSPCLGRLHRQSLYPNPANPLRNVLLLECSSGASCRSWLGPSTQWTWLHCMERGLC